MMRLLLRLLLLAVAGLGLAAVIGSLLPENGNWREARKGTTIYVVSNGYHTGLILPASADGLDLSLTFRPTDLADPDDVGDYLLFGWGDRDFYRNTPHWSDVRVRTVITALAGSGATLLHVDHLTRPEEVADLRPVRLTRAEYLRLVNAIVATVRRGEDGHAQASPGYGSRDIFYEAYGRYDARRTCNVWTRDMLAAAGVKIGRWTPFSGGVMRWFPAQPVKAD